MKSMEHFANVPLWYMNNKIWVKIDTSGGRDSCWPWKGKCDAKGYGIVRIDGFNTRAHIVSYYLSQRTVDVDHYVMHSCDNPPCCNPKHLSGGTPMENTMDMIRKNRARRNPLRGEKHHQSKLTMSDVIKIRQLAKSKNAPPHESIGTMFRCSQTTISRIVRGEAWSHLNDAESPVKRNVHNRATTTWETVRELRSMFATGQYTHLELAIMFGMTPSNVGAIVRGHSWINDPQKGMD